MKTFLFAVLLVLSLTSFGQQTVDTRYPDSLENLLRKPVSDTSRAKTLFLLSQYWADLDSAKGVHYVLEALKYNPGGDYYEGEAHYYTGGAFFEYDIPRAKREYLLAQQFLQNVHTNEGYALCSKAWHNYGALEERTGNEKSFADILLNKVIPLALKAGDTLHVGIYEMSLGVVFSNIFDYDRSTYYYQKAIVQFKKKNDTGEKLLNCYSKIADNYVSKQNYQLAGVFLDATTSP